MPQELGTRGDECDLAKRLAHEYDEIPTVAVLRCLAVALRRARSWDCPPDYFLATVERSARWLLEVRGDADEGHDGPPVREAVIHPQRQELRTLMHTRTWNVSVQISEDGQTTRAVAVLHTDAGTELRHEGFARRHPGDRDVPEIGDELATCRALAGLAHDLLEATAGDVEQNVGTGSPVHVDL
jgi:hypothetical protein